MFLYLRILVQSLLLLIPIQLICSFTYKVTINELLNGVIALYLYPTYIYIIFSLFFYTLRGANGFNNFFWKNLSSKGENIKKLYETYCLCFISIAALNLVVAFFINDEIWVNFKLFVSIWILLIPLYLTIIIKKSENI